jgi:uncharacterized membrane protein YfcA
MDAANAAQALLSVPIGFLIGFWAGVSGYSGWPIVVPLLFVVSGVPLHESLLVCVLVDLANATVAALVYGRRGEVELGRAVRLAAAALPVALLGVFLSFAWLSGFTSLLRGATGWVGILIGALLLVRAVRMPADSQERGVAPLAQTAGVADRLRPLRYFAALWVGLVMGLIGAGGGFSLAVVLMFLAGLPVRHAVGTAMTFTALLLIPVALAYAVRLDLVLPFGWGLLPGIVASAFGCGLAARVAARVLERQLNFVIAISVILAGILATAQAWVLAC